MDPAVQAFKDKMAEKAAAKAKVMAALGEKRLAEKMGRPVKEHDDVIAEHGIDGGTEGVAMAEMQTMADAYVAAHPEMFTAVRPIVNEPDAIDQIVKLINIYSEAGMEEEVLKLTMFELAAFERQQIGVTTRAKVRIGMGE